MAQIAADVVLCVAILFLLRQLNKKQKAPPPASPSPVNEQTMHEFRMLLGESQQAANSFLTSMEESRKKLREIVQLLDNKEKSCREILEQSVEMRDLSARGNGKEGPSAPEKRYGAVIELSGQGLTEEEIGRRTGLTEGEIRLTLDLHRSRNGHE